MLTLFDMDIRAGTTSLELKTEVVVLILDSRENWRLCTNY